MQVTPVDERDAKWEGDQPVFRVYLHTSEATSTSGATATYDVTGADVLQVIDWAQHQAGDRMTYAVALVLDAPDRGRGLVWLVGIDGNDDTSADPVRAQFQQRMLARRTAPVCIADSDRWPGRSPA
jgi:hypothetical protein